MVFLGIDLHSNCFTCCFIYDNGKKLRMNFNIDEISQFINHLNFDTYVMIEASTNTFKFVDLIKDRVKCVYVANTHKLKLISMVKKKTDKIDAEKLAIFLKMQISSNEELIKPVYIPEQTIQELRSFFTDYKLVRKQIGMIKNRIHSILKQNLKPFTKEYIFGKKNRSTIRELMVSKNTSCKINRFFNILEFLEIEIIKIEKSIKLLGKKYYKQIDILTSMRGISVITAIAIIADIATIKRFPNSKHFTSYLRSAPGVDSSNNTTKITKTTKMGRKLSVTFLSQSLNHFRDSNEKLNRWYTKKVVIQEHKKGKIRMGLCRKVFAEIYQMLKKEEYHYWIDESNHRKKMKEYDVFLEKNDFSEDSA